MLEKGKRIPNWTVKDNEGESRVLWDYRQKSHLVLIYDPEADADKRRHWRAAIHVDRKQWDWLNAALLLVKAAPEEMTPGIYLIDRYGFFLNYFPLDRWNFDDLEREFLYYEARHC